MRPLLTIFLLSFSLFQHASYSLTPDRRTNLLEAKARMQERFVGSRRSTVPNLQFTMTPFFLEEFASGLPANWTNVDSAGSGRRWRHSNNACGQCDALYIGTGIDSLSVVGTSSANGIVMYDSDSSGASIGGDYGVLTSPPINCSGRTAVQLSFNELFVYCNDQVNPVFPNTARVYVSNNNVNWTLVHSADAGLSVCGDFTPNPTTVSVDISGIAANQPSVYIRFSFTGDYSYWWFLDDVALTQPFPYEAELLSIQPVTNGCNLSNNEPISITVRNNGSQTIANFPVSYRINGGAPVVETITNPIPTNGTVTHTFNQRADFSFPGSYTIVASVNLSNDAYTLNDADTSQAVCTLPANSYPYSNGFESAIDYDGCIVWDFDGDGRIPSRTASGPHTGSYCLEFPSSASGTSYDKWCFLPCVNLVSGQDYLVDFWTACSSPSGAGRLRGYLCTGTDPADTVITFQNCIASPTSSFAMQACTFVPQQTGTYHLAFRYSGYNVQSPLRLDDIGIDLTVGIEESLSSTQHIIFPNPGDGRFRISNATGSGAFRLIVRDALGKSVLVRSCDGSKTEEIDLGDAADGLYWVLLVSDSRSEVFRLSVNR